MTIQSNTKHKSRYFDFVKRGIFVFSFLAFVLTLSGCALFKDCLDYMSYDDILDSWVGSNVSEYESRNDKSPLRYIDRPQNRIEYEYDTAYVQYDGTRLPCKTWLTVDRDTGKIVTWRYEGECYMYGRCNQYE